MGIESAHRPEKTPRPFETEFGDEYRASIPKEFLQDPFGYFKREGVPIKSGEPQYDAAGRLRDDPTAVRVFPVWKNTELVIEVVAKKVNTGKGMLAETGDPLYEYNLLSYVRSLGLPAPKPIGFVESAEETLFLTEKASGYAWPELSKATEGWSEIEVATFTKDAEQKMKELKSLFEQHNVSRKWKLTDMVFQIDKATRRLTAVIPTDFERTKVLVPREG